MKNIVIAAMAAALCAASGPVPARGETPANRAWYDFIFDSEPPAELPPPEGMEQEPSGAAAKLVPISGHFTVSSDSAMALKLRSGSGDKLVERLSAMGFAVTSHEDFHGGYFLMVNVGATDPVEAAFAFMELGEVSEVWVRQSLYDAVMLAR